VILQGHAVRRIQTPQNRLQSRSFPNMTVNRRFPTRGEHNLPGSPCTIGRDYLHVLPKSRSEYCGK